MAEDEKTSDDPIDQYLVGSLAQWAKGKRLSELEVVVDAEDIPCFADTIERYDFVKKVAVEHEVYLRVPPMRELAIAKVESLRALAALAQRDPQTFDIEAAIKIYGSGHVDHRENLHVLARAIRKRRDPKEPYMTPDNLERCHPVAALWTTMEKLSHYRKMLDMRISDEGLQDERLFWGIVAAMAKGNTTSPFAAIDGPAQDSFLLSMARRLIEYRTKLSSLPSSESSTSTG